MHVEQPVGEMMNLNTLNRIISAARAIVVIRETEEELQEDIDARDAMHVLRCARRIPCRNRHSDEELDSMIDAMNSCGQHHWSVIATEGSHEHGD